MSEMSTPVHGCFVEEDQASDLYDEKYIIGEFYSGELKYALFSARFHFHREITQHYASKGHEFRVRGGGILVIDRKGKKVRTFGRSGSYGVPNRDLVEKILQEHFPGFEIDCQVTSYIRD